MIKVGSLINSEGSILSLHCDSDGEIIIQAYSSEYNGTLSITTKFRDCISYVESKINLEELITISSNCIFTFSSKSDLRRIPLESIVRSLPFIDKYYKEVPEALK